MWTPHCGVIKNFEEVSDGDMVKVGQNDTICVWEILKNFEVGKQNQFVPCCHKTSVGVDSKVKQKASTLKNYNN